MKKTVLIIFAVFLMGKTEVNAQLSTYSNQELIRELEVEQDPVKIAEIYGRLINRYIYQDMDTMYIYASGFLEFANESEDEAIIVDALYNLGRYHAMKGDTEESIDQFKKAYDLVINQDNPLLTGRIVGMIGYTYYTDQQYDNALEYYEKSLEYFEQTEYKRPVAISLSTIGSIYYQKVEDEIAKEYYLRALAIKEELKDSVIMTSDLKNLALIYQNKNEYDSALVFLSRALEIDEKTGVARKLIGSYEDMAKLHIELKNYDLALSFGNKALELSKEYNSYQQLRDSYEVLYRVYDATGDKARALENYISYKAYSDSILNEASRNKLIEEQEKYESAKKEQEIELLESENQLQKTRMVLVSVILGASLLVFVLFFLKTVFKKRKELELKEKDKLLSDSQRKLAEEELEKEKLKAEHVQKELTNYALHIAEKNDFLEQLKEQIYDIRFGACKDEIRKELARIEMKIFQNVTINEEREELQSKVDEVCSGFFLRLKSQFPELSENDKRLAVFLRLNLSSKDIASILNIEPKSVQQSRYRLRKKLGLDPGEDMQKVLSTV